VAWLFAARAVLGVAQGMLSGAAGLALWFVPETADRQSGGLRVRRPGCQARSAARSSGSGIRIGLTGAAV